MIEVNQTGNLIHLSFVAFHDSLLQNGFLTDIHRSIELFQSRLHRLDGRRQSLMRLIEVGIICRNRLIQPGQIFNPRFQSIDLLILGHIEPRTRIPNDLRHRGSNDRLHIVILSLDGIVSLCNGFQIHDRGFHQVHGMQSLDHGVGDSRIHQSRLNHSLSLILIQLLGVGITHHEVEGSIRTGFGSKGIRECGFQSEIQNTILRDLIGIHHSHILCSHNLLHSFIQDGVEEGFVLVRSPKSTTGNTSKKRFGSIQIVLIVVRGVILLLTFIFLFVFLVLFIF